MRYSACSARAFRYVDVNRTTPWDASCMQYSSIPCSCSLAMIWLAFLSISSLPIFPSSGLLVHLFERATPTKYRNAKCSGSRRATRRAGKASVRLVASPRAIASHERATRQHSALFTAGRTSNFPRQYCGAYDHASGKIPFSPSNIALSRSRA